MVADTPEGTPQHAEGSAKSLFELGKGRITDTLSQTTEAIRETGRRMDEQAGTASPVSRFASRAAESLDRAARYVTDAQPRAVMRDINSFARRQPEVFLGGALLAGVLLGRFLRSRPPEDVDHDGHEGQDRYEGTPEPEHQEYSHGV